MKNHISKLKITNYKKSQFNFFLNTNTNTIIYLFIYIFNLILIPLNVDDHPQILRKSGQRLQCVVLQKNLLRRESRM